MYDRLLRYVFMKDLVIPLLLIAAALAGTWLYVSRTGATILSHYGVTRSPSVPNPPAAEPPKVSRRKTSKVSAEQRRKDAAVEEATLVVNVPMPEDPTDAAKAGAKLDRGLPFRTELKRGMTAQELRDRFGNPDLATITIEGGSLLETYVYYRKSDDSMTAVRLSNGGVDLK
jgi:hypothetical protein